MNRSLHPSSPATNSYPSGTKIGGDTLATLNPAALMKRGTTIRGDHRVFNQGAQVRPTSGDSDQPEGHSTYSLRIVVVTSGVGAVELWRRKRFFIVPHCHLHLFLFIL